jgi:hypothetical protein
MFISVFLQSASLGISASVILLVGRSGKCFMVKSFFVDDEFVFATDSEALLRPRKLKFRGESWSRQLLILSSLVMVQEGIVTSEEVGGKG